VLKQHVVIAVLAAVITSFTASAQAGADPFAQARENADTAMEGFVRCHRYVEGWLMNTDFETGLIPRNLTNGRDIWNAQDSAADNYPFMVLTAAITDRPMFEGTMYDMLKTERQLTSRIGSLPDTWSFSKNGFLDPEPDLGRSIFGASEYVKDGLLPLTELLGKTPWTQRMIEMLNDMWERAPVETPFGAIVSENHEINGEMLQTLSRVYWMTGDTRYLEWAVRLGDYYLLGDHHPTRDSDRLRLRDHGCEIVSGLCELYATVNYASPSKKTAYEQPLHEMLDRILDVGRNADGLFYNVIDPQTGAQIPESGSGVADTWGYTLNGYYTVYLIDRTKRYHEAVLTALNVINERYRSFDWENGSADGYADAIESALNLYNREPVPSVADWTDSEIRVMWGKQRKDGIVEGWHGDGNFARTTIMYCLWKTCGLTAEPWREDVRFGAMAQNDSLYIAFRAEHPWDGMLVFDIRRHAYHMNLPFDWPRINQFPEWFTVEPDESYEVVNLANGRKETISGRDLRGGLHVEATADSDLRLIVTRK